MTQSEMKEPASMQKQNPMRNDGNSNKEYPRGEGMEKGKPSCQQHHNKAAECHEKAAKSHREAAKLHESGDQKGAAHHAHIAHGHSVSAQEHAEGASKEYVAAYDDQKGRRPELL